MCNLINHNVSALASCTSHAPSSIAGDNALQRKFNNRSICEKGVLVCERHIPENTVLQHPRTLNFADFNHFFFLYPISAFLHTHLPKMSEHSASILWEHYKGRAIQAWNGRGWTAARGEKNNIARLAVNLFKSLSLNEAFFACVLCIICLPSASMSPSLSLFLLQVPLAARDIPKIKMQTVMVFILT